MTDGELTGDETEGNHDQPSEYETDGSATGGTVTVSIDGRDVSLALPADAKRDEAAAIATAVGAHLQDRAAAAAAAEASRDEEFERADAWKVAGRMKAVGRSRWPKDVRRGDEWKAAARSFY